MDIDGWPVDQAITQAPTRSPNVAHDDSSSLCAIALRKSQACIFFGAQASKHPGSERGRALDEPDAVPEANLAELGRGDRSEVLEIVLGQEQVGIERREDVERGKHGQLADGRCD